MGPLRPESHLVNSITMKLILLFAVVAVASAAPKPKQLNFRNLYKEPVGEIKIKPKPRIIGGIEAEPHSIPYQVLVDVSSSDDGWYCGGSLISVNYVLTAGHCGYEAIEAIVTLGAHKPLTDEDTQVHIKSNDIKVHEEYDDDLLINDVSVFKLSESVTLTDAIQLATLPSRADASNTYVGVSSRVSGWGLTDGFGDELADVLYYVDVKVISNRECEDYFGDLPETNICTSGDDNTGVCNGDSGGPLVVGGVQIGVVSFGVIFCFDGYPSGYARVTSYLDWIETNTDVKIK